MASIMVLRQPLRRRKALRIPVAAFYMRPGKPVIARRLLAKFVIAGK